MIDSREKTKEIIDWCNKECGARICLTDEGENLLKEKMQAALETAFWKGAMSRVTGPTRKECNHYIKNFAKTCKHKVEAQMTLEIINKICHWFLLSLRVTPLTANDLFPDDIEIENQSLKYLNKLKSEDVIMQDRGWGFIRLDYIKGIEYLRNFVTEKLKNA